MNDVNLILNIVIYTTNHARKKTCTPSYTTNHRTHLKRAKYHDNRPSDSNGLNHKESKHLNKFIIHIETVLKAVKNCGIKYIFYFY